MAPSYPLMRRHFIGLAALLTVAILHLPAEAVVLTSTTKTQFDGHTSGYTSSTLDFEGNTSGDPVPPGSTLGGVTFDYASSEFYDTYGLEMVVASNYATTSGSSYLGLDDGGDNQFIAGDTFTFTFASAINAIGLYLISGAPGEVLPGDFGLDNGSDIAWNDTTDPIDLGDDGFAYFVGLVDTENPFSSVTLVFGDDTPPGAFGFNIDDISYASEALEEGAVPEPATLAIWSIVALSLGAARVRRRLPTSV